MKKQSLFFMTNVLVITIPLLLGIWLHVSLFISTQNNTIKVGILHSMTGPMATSERPVVDATLLALEEINQQGGLLGRYLEPVIVDGQSDPKIFEQQALNLITRDQAAVIFGCWTSSSRKAVKPIIENHNTLLFYPVQYEGLEQSPNIIYTAAVPNQQIIPGVSWCLRNLGKRFFLVGSDYVYSRAAHEVIKKFLETTEGEVVGDAYIPLGSRDVKDIIKHIQQTAPDVIINTIDDDACAIFYRLLRKAGITQQKIPSMIFSITEGQLQSIGVEHVDGDYATWNYFQDISLPENQIFLEKMRKKYGASKIVSDPDQAAYVGVHLWAKAVKETQSLNADIIKQAITNKSFSAPEGVVYVDGKTQHTWKTIRIAQIQKDGSYKIVWNSEQPVQPVPYPDYESKKTWHDFLHNLYVGWENQWEKPTD